MCMNFAKDFMTIKEFSECVGIKAETLRRYDNDGIFYPAHKVTEPDNGYRMYSAQQITIAKMLRVMAYEMGLTQSGIKHLVEIRTPEVMLKALKKRSKALRDLLDDASDSLAVNNIYIELISESLCVSEDEVYLCEMPERPLNMGEPNDYHNTGNFMSEFLRFCFGSHTPKLNLSFPIGGYFENMETFMLAPSLPNRFFSIDPHGNERKESGLYIVGYTRGYYGETNDLPQRLTYYAEKNGLEFSGPVYCIFIADELSVPEPSEYLLQVSAAVKESRYVPERRNRLLPNKRSYE